jgi:uncharacterized repeat protein (TIGR02543 family)
MKRMRVTTAAGSAILLAGLIGPVSGVGAAQAAELPGTVYAAAYLGADELSETSLPATLSDGATDHPVAWAFDAETFAVPYATVPVRGTAGGAQVTAQVEVLPPAANPLVYFVDAGHNGDSQALPYSALLTSSHAFTAVSSLAAGSLKNTLPDQRYVEGSTDWGYTYGGANNYKITVTNGDPNPSDQQTLGSYGKDELGVRTNGTQIAFRLALDPGTYTLSSGFFEFYSGTRTRVMRPTLSYSVDGAAAGQALDQVSLTSTAAGTRVMGTSDFTIPDGATDITLTYAQVSGEAPCLSWFAIASGDVEQTIEDAVAAAAATVDVTVDADAIAADNVNGLTFKGFGVLSANSTSALLMDYKAQHPDEYAELLQILFGGEHPIMDHVKIEMGNDRNNSTGSDVATMRTETEPANVTRHPGFQLAADASKVNPNLTVSILRWNAPAWANTNDKIYTWYKNTILAAYREYGYMVDYVNPGVNEATPSFAWTKDYANRVRTDTTGYVSADAGQAGFRPGEADLYHQIKVVISDESGLGSFGDDMIADASLRDAVAVAGYHYTTEDTGAKDFTRLAEQFDEEVWNSEAQATFSNSSFRPNNNTPDPTVAGTGIGGINSPLEMGNTIIKGFVNSRRTHFIYQPAIGSFYEGGQYSYKELVSARDPWSGWIHYDAGLAVLQHFSSFAVTGWENATNTAGIWRVVPQASTATSTGTNPVNGRNGLPNYLTLAAPDKTGFSTVVVNDSEYARTYRITPQHFDLGADPSLAVWETRAADEGEAFDANYKQHVADVAASASGTYSVRVKPYSVVTITSLDVAGDEGWTAPLPVEGERTVLDADPEHGVLWADDFDYSDKTVPVIAAGGGLSAETEPFVDSRGGLTGAIPLYTWDRNGAFEAYRTTDGEDVLRQQLDRTATGVGGAWNGGDPVTGIGDHRWTSYRASVDVRFERGPASDNYAAIGARSTGGDNSQQLARTPYVLRLSSNGTWLFQRTGTTSASGFVAGFDATAWHRLSIQVAGTQVTGFVDGDQVFTWTETGVPYRSGRVDLASGFYNTQFDNLSVERVPDHVPYYGEYLDNLEMNDLADPSVAKLVYAGSWRHVNGGGMYEYQRSSSTNQTAGATLAYTFTGSGLDLTGLDDGSARLNVRMDGEIVALGQPTRQSGQYQQTYALRGLPYGEHTVELEVVAGRLAIDAVGVLESRPDVPASTDSIVPAIAAAEQIERTDDFKDRDWALLTTAIRMARAAVADPAGYGLDAEGAGQLVGRLEAAGNPLANQIVAVPQAWSATFVDQAPAGLPATLTAQLNDGTTRDLPVTWNLAGLDFRQPWATVAVPGTVSGLPTTAWVEVVPLGLTYFADVNGTSGWSGSLGYDSPAYLAVADLLDGALLNGAPDQVYQGDRTWGHYAQNAAGTRDLQYRGPSAGAYSKVTTTGLYTANQVGAEDRYTFTLPAGRYTIAAGSYSWWASSSRSYNVFLDYDGAPHQVASAVTLNTATPGRTLSYDITLAAPGTVTLRLRATNAQSPMLSWAAAVAGAYGVGFDLNGAEGSVPAVQGLLWTDAVLLPGTEPTRPGFDFTGWSTAADGSGVTAAPGGAYSALAGDRTVASVTLHAQWEPTTSTQMSRDPDGSPIIDATPTFHGFVMFGTSVKVTDGDTELCTVPVTDGTWTCQVTTPLADGRHTVTAAGYLGAERATIPVGDTFVVDTSATLQALAVSPGALSPAFDPARGAYRVTVPAGTTRLTITPTATDSRAEITVGGRAAPSGQPIAVGIAHGDVVTIVVTPPAGSASVVYELTAYVLDPASPARGTLSTTAGWSGLQDGNFDVKLDLWWGQNARELRLFENGTLIATVPLSYDGLAAQHATVPVHGLLDGTYVYTGELVNRTGATATTSTTVTVTQAAPGKPALRASGWSGTGRTLITDLWWGTNATEYELWQDGRLVDTRALTASTPSAQHVETVVTGLTPGRHEFVSVLRNHAGETRSDVVVVTIT